MNKRGTVLVWVLLLTAVLLMLAAVVLSRLRSDTFLGRGQESDARAFLATESGLALCLSHLGEDHDWVEGVEGTLDDGQSKYSVEFASNKSVNNITGSEWLDGPRGPKTVEPGTAHLVCVGSSGIRSKSIVAVVSPSGLLGNRGSAVLNSGRIVMKGDVRIDGFDSFTEAVSSGADVFSLSDENIPDIITWRPESGQNRADIQGDVGIVSLNPQAIDLGSASVTGKDNDYARNPVAPPKIDIKGRILANSHHSEPSLQPGFTKLEQGDFYFASDLSYLGDIELDGSNLYVDGDLEIVGSVKGHGSLTVGGTTSLLGDSDVVPFDANGIAVYSRGSISLRGYDAYAYLQNVTAASGDDDNGIAYGEHLQNVLDWTQTMYDILEENIPTYVLGDILAPLNQNPDEIANLPFGVNRSQLDLFSDSLAHSIAANLPINFTGDESTTNPLGRLRELVETQPQSRTRDFVLERFRWFFDTTPDGFDHGFLAWGNDPSEDTSPGASFMRREALPTEIVEGGTTDAMLDVINDGQGQSAVWNSLSDDRKDELYNTLLAAMSQIAGTRFANAQFQGLLYTNGAIYSANGINITGSLIAIDDGSQPPLSVSGETLMPGDIMFENQANVTMVEDLAVSSGQSLKAMHVRSWTEL